MSWALTACILIRVHARPQQWVPVDELAAHLAVDVATLRTEAQSMVEHGHLKLQRDPQTDLISHVCAVMPARGAAA